MLVPPTEPVTSTVPRVASVAKFDMIERHLGRPLALICQAQGHPVPSFRSVYIFAVNCYVQWLVRLHFCLCVLSWVYMARFYIIYSNIYMHVTWYRYKMGGRIHVSCTFISEDLLILDEICYWKGCLHLYLIGHLWRVCYMRLWGSNSCIILPITFFRSSLLCKFGHRT